MDPSQLWHPQFANLIAATKVALMADIVHPFYSMSLRPRHVRAHMLKRITDSLEKLDIPPNVAFEPRPPLVHGGTWLLLGNRYEFCQLKENRLKEVFRKLDKEYPRPAIDPDHSSDFLTAKQYSALPYDAAHLLIDFSQSLVGTAVIPREELLQVLGDKAVCENLKNYKA